MRPTIVLLFIFSSLLQTNAQISRLELLTRSEQNPVRSGASAISSAPEVSADGKFVLFLSSAANLAPTSPAPTAPNLYLFNRETRQTTLVSIGADGQPGNEPIEGWQFSANNRRILFETRASNIVPNDTNTLADIFIRDLDSNQTILVTINTNNLPAHRGGSEASMDASGTRVTFLSRSSDLGVDLSLSQDVFVRDLIEGKTQVVNFTTNTVPSFTFFGSPTISDDGNIIAFMSSSELINGVPGFYTIPYVFDLASRELQQANAGLLDMDDGPFLSANGQFVLFNTQLTATTNLLVRFHVETGTQELVGSNLLGSAAYMIPLAISSNGQTIIYSQTIAVGSPARQLYAWKQTGELIPFPKNINGENVVAGINASSVELSADGSHVTFASDAELLVDPQSRPGFQPYLYDLENQTIRLLSARNDGNGIPDGPSPNPHPSGDGSVVVFAAISDEVDSQNVHPVANIYAWESGTGRAKLISESIPALFDNTASAGAWMPETGAISEDGQKIVYASLAPAPGAADTNATWDVFVLDRATGAAELISKSTDGQSAGNKGSFKPIISGDGNSVAFLSAATNLVANEVPPGFSLYVRNRSLGTTRLIANVNPATRLDPNVLLSISRDGGRIAFATRARLEPRDSNDFFDIYLWNATNGSVALVSYAATQTAAGSADSTLPSISPDGQYVAFRSKANNLGISFNGILYPVFVRYLQTGTLRKPSPNNVGSSANTAIQFNRASTRILYGATAPSVQDRGTFQLFTLATSNNVAVCTNCLEASVSEDGQWMAYVQNVLPASFTTRPVILRKATTGAATVITTNGINAQARVSDDGRFVVFQGRAANIVSNVVDNNKLYDLFLFDRAQNRLDLISGVNQIAGNSASQRPVISPDQSYILFKSHATHLVPNDFNNAPDLFAAYLPVPDTDQDQIDDRWEDHHFETGAHTGEEDSDSDGLTDLEEYLAGLDPTLSESTLRIISIQQDAETVQIRWSAVPRRAYQIQSTENFRDWQNVGAPIIASKADMILTFPIPISAHTFLRITLSN